jgi:hypothetical protein
MNVKNMINVPRTQLPPIKIRQTDSERLAQLAEAAAETSPPRPNSGCENRTRDGRSDTEPLAASSGWNPK